LLQIIKNEFVDEIETEDNIIPNGIIAKVSLMSVINLSPFIVLL